MGCSESKVYLKEENEKLPTKTEPDVVEIFTLEVLRSGNSFDAVKRILSIELARSYFMTYLKSEFSSENLTFYLDVEKLKAKSDDEIMLEKMRMNYLTPGAAQEVNISDSLKTLLLQQLNRARSDNSSSLADLMKSFITAQNETVAIMASNGYQRFIESQIYSAWRVQEREYSKLYFTVPSDESPGLQSDAICDLPRESKQWLDDLFQLVDNSDMSSIRQSASWLSSLLVASESLPVGISLCAADSALGNFPIIFANAGFEALVGYSRNETFGKPHSFYRNKSKSSKKFAYSMKREVSYATRKDGTIFQVLSVGKMLKDKDGTAVFVLFMHQEILPEGATQPQNRLADKVFCELPSTV